jgi:hypothetical protein
MFDRVMTRLRLRQLLGRWTEFHHCVLNLEGSPEVTPKQREQFLRLQARIAGLLPLLVTVQNPDIIAESKSHLGLMTDLLNEHRTLDREKPPGPEAREGFEQSWHRHYLYLNKLAGSAWTTGVRAGTGPSRHRTPTGVPTWRGNAERPVVRLLGFTVRLALFALAIFLLGRAFGVRWKEGGAFTAQAPGSLGAAGQQAQGGLQAIWTGAVRFFDPVAAAYGPGVTLFLLGLLAVLLTYWFFLRGR